MHTILFSVVYAQNDSSGVKPDSNAIRIAPLVRDTVMAPETSHSTRFPEVQEKIRLSPDTADSLVVQSNLPGSFPISPYGSFVAGYLTHHPYYNISSSVVFMPSKWHVPENKDELFYGFCGILFFLGILRLGFPKYFQDIFHVFWRPAVRQKQIRDQIQQAGMTGLLFNIFFVFSAALFSYLIIQYTIITNILPRFLIALCFTGIVVIYLGKYAVLKLTGWMFGQQNVASAYIFTVFLINKVLSILLIPLMIMLAFGDKLFQQIAFTVSVILLFFLLIYRFILSFSGLHNELKIGWFHLFLYVCGFEIIPVLLIYKLLLYLLRISL